MKCALRYAMYNLVFVFVVFIARKRAFLLLTTQKQTENKIRINAQKVEK